MVGICELVNTYTVWMFCSACDSPYCLKNYETLNSSEVVTGEMF